MSNLISFVDSYAVNALWQVPLVGAAGWAASRLLKRLGPQAQHVAWVATLLLAVLTPAVPRWHWHASAREGMLVRMAEERALAAVPPMTHPAVVAPVNSVPFSVAPSDASQPDVSIAPRRSLAARPRVGRSVAAPMPPSLDGSVPLDFAVAGPAVPFVAPAPAARASGVTLLPAATVFALLLCYLGALLYFAARFGWSLYRVAMLQREAEPLCFDAESEAVWARCRDTFALGAVRTLLSPAIVGPVTIGFAKPVLLVPTGFVERCSAHDLLATLGHECAHIRRRDFQKNLMYEAASLLIAFHPVTWMLKQQIAQTREMVCDGRAVERLIDVQHYVQALLRLAAAISGRAMLASSPAIGIFDGNILEKRILTMKAKRQRVSAALRCGLVLAGALVLAGVATAGSARAVAVEAKRPMTAKVAEASAFAQVVKMFQAVTGTKPGQRSSANMAGAVLKTMPVIDQIDFSAVAPTEWKNHRLMVMFFDRSSMQVEDSHRAADTARDYVNTKMQPADLVSMVSLAGGALNMDQDFTSDKDLLRKTLDKYDGMASGGELNEQSISRSLDAIRGIATSLEKIDQRKTMLYFSGGWTRQDIEHAASMRAATDEAVKAKMYIYAVDARGLEALPPLPQAAVSPQAIPDAGAISDVINVGWPQLQALNPDVPLSQQKSVVQQFDGKTINISGFMVPLKDGANSVNEFLLIPYPGTGIHAPPPPQNQMIYVKMDGDAKVPVTADPILVTGPFKISTVISPYGDLSYQMTGITVKPYASPEAMAAARQATQVALLQQLNGTYRKWVDEDVRWIITDQELAAFNRLSNDEERDRFIEDFWQRRNPTPDSKVNPYREEYYRRIAYAKEHFATTAMPGWKSDRGQIYIKFGKPDSSDDHPAEGQDTRPAQEGGGNTATYPFEVWHYRSLAGIGDNIDIEFVDTCRCGEYHATVDRSEKNAQKQSKEFDRLETFAKLGAPPPVRFKDLEEYMAPSKVLTGPLFPFDVRIDYKKGTKETVTVPLTLLTLQLRNKDITFSTKDGVALGRVNILGTVSDIAGKPIQTFEDTVKVDTPSALLERTQNAISIYWKSLSLPQGNYRVEIVIKDFNSPDHIGRWSGDINVPKDGDIQPAAASQTQSNRSPVPGYPGLKAGPEILSDTQAVDFSAYMRRLHDDIKRNWESLIPEEVNPPTFAKGTTGIRFTILPNGEISGMTLETRSGDAALDQAAWSAIASGGKFQPLPKEFHGPNLELRCGFSYNTEPPQAAAPQLPATVSRLSLTIP